MKKQNYHIQVWGTEDETEFNIELTTQEYQTIKKLAETCEKAGEGNDYASGIEINLL